MAPDVYPAIVAALKALIESVPHSGIVHDRYRYASDWSAFLSDFAYTDPAPDPLLSPSLAPALSTFRGWMITRADITPAEDGSSFGHVTRVHHMRLMFFSAFSDDPPSEPTFQLVLDRTLSALESERQVFERGDLAAPCVVNGPGFASATSIELRQFGRVLAHYSEIHFPFPVEETIALTAYPT